MCRSFSGLIILLTGTVADGHASVILVPCVSVLAEAGRRARWGDEASVIQSGTGALTRVGVWTVDELLVVRTVPECVRESTDIIGILFCLGHGLIFDNVGSVRFSRQHQWSSFGFWDYLLSTTDRHYP